MQISFHGFKRSKKTEEEENVKEKKKTKRNYMKNYQTLKLSFEGCRGGGGDDTNQLRYAIISSQSCNPWVKIQRLSSISKTYPPERALQNLTTTWVFFLPDTDHAKQARNMTEPIACLGGRLTCSDRMSRED